MINTHGIKLIDKSALEKASAETVNWPQGCGYLSIIRYDPEDGRVWVTEASEDQLGTRYDVFRTGTHVSAQTIADMIAEHQRMIKYAKER